MVTVDIFGYKKTERHLLGTNFAEFHVVENLLLMLFISLFFLWVGFFVSEKIKTGKLKIKEAFSNKTIMNISFIFFLISFFFKLIFWYEAITVSQNIGYFNYFSNFKSSLPSIIILIGDMFPVAFFLFLASYPAPKKLIIPIILYLLEGGVAMATGTRSIFMLNILVVIIYLASRSLIGKKSSFIIGISMPFIVIILGFIEQIRNQFSTATSSITGTFLEFFYAQGVSVNLLGYVQTLKNMIPEKFYTLGPITEYLMTKIWWPINGHNINLFGQTAERAIEGFQFSHTMSYLIMPDLYLSGVGYGSSYIAEWFHDFGWLGLIVGNLGLGVLLLLFTKMLYSRSFTLIFLSLLMIRMSLFVPRASSVAFIIDAFPPTNIIAIFVIAIFILLVAPYVKKRTN